MCQKEERSQQREPSQEEVCQAKEEQEHGQGARRGEETCQAHTDLELETSPAPGPVPGSRGGPVPEQLNLSNQQTSLVPSSVMIGGVGVWQN